MKQSNLEIITNNKFKMARDYFSNLVFARGNSKPTITSCYDFAFVALEMQVPKKEKTKEKQKEINHLKQKEKETFMEIINLIYQEVHVIHRCLKLRQQYHLL